MPHLLFGSWVVTLGQHLRGLNRRLGITSRHDFATAWFLLLFDLLYEGWQLWLTRTRVEFAYLLLDEGRCVIFLSLVSFRNSALNVYQFRSESDIFISDFLWLLSFKSFVEARYTLGTSLASQLLWLLVGLDLGGAGLRWPFLHFAEPVEDAFILLP